MQTPKFQIFEGYAPQMPPPAKFRPELLPSLAPFPPPVLVQNLKSITAL